MQTSSTLTIADLNSATNIDYELLKKLPPRVISNDLSSSLTGSLRFGNKITTPDEAQTAASQHQASTFSSSVGAKIVAPPSSEAYHNHTNAQMNASATGAMPDTTSDLQRQKQLDLSMRSQIEDMKISYIEHYQLNEQKLKQELLDQARTSEALMAARENHWKEVLEEKEKHMQVMLAQHQREVVDYKKRLHDKDEFYVSQMTAMEKQFQQQQIDLDKRWQDRVKVLQDQINIDRERQSLTEKAKLEAKESSLQAQFEKKVKKYTKQIESVMDHYKSKELMIQGALEEARREIINLQANHSALEQVNREELMLKDKRLVEIQQYLDEADAVNRRAEEWKILSRDLASLVIHACATVEELPAELWTSTTPGLFTSVWDELHQKQTGSNTRPGYGKVTVDDHVRSYSEKKKDCVVANRAELAKCLKYSKVVHDRVRIDDLRPMSPSKILS